MYRKRMFLVLVLFAACFLPTHGTRKFQRAITSCHVARKREPWKAIPTCSARPPHARQVFSVHSCDDGYIDVFDCTDATCDAACIAHFPTQANAHSECVATPSGSTPGCIGYCECYIVNTGFAVAAVGPRTWLDYFVLDTTGTLIVTCLAPTCHAYCTERHYQRSLCIPILPLPRPPNVNIQNTMSKCECSDQESRKPRPITVEMIPRSSSRKQCILPTNAPKFASSIRDILIGSASSGVSGVYLGLSESSKKRRHLKSNGRPNKRQSANY